MIGRKEDRKSRDTIDRLSEGYLMAEAPGIAQDLAKVKKTEAQLDVKVREAEAEDQRIRLEAREACRDAKAAAIRADEALGGLNSAFYSVESIAQMIGFAAPKWADPAETTRQFFDGIVTPAMDAMHITWVRKEPEDPLAPVELPKDE